LHKDPQEKLKVLVMAGLATKKVGAEPGLRVASPLVVLFYFTNLL